MIEYDLKVKCVSALRHMTTRQVFDTIFVPAMGDIWSYESFKRQMRTWKHKQLADDATLACGTFPNFTPHGATVQVDKEGRITQVWVKQQKETLDWLKIRDLVCKGAPKIDVQPTVSSGERMLEIPLVDMHFGVADLDYYRENLADLLEIVRAKQWDEINIIIGQDVLHNNDMRGHTAKGTPIEKIDFQKAWADAQVFFRTLISAAIEQGKVRLHYSKGNHDECSGWCFYKTLEAVFPQVESDDSLLPRKCIFWKGCFIGFGHCEYTSKSSLLFQNFVLDFPQEFANSKVREIHSGHLHREGIDEGFMVRRLPSAVPTDEWSSNNGYIGAHKRFQVFEWAENRLKTIHYL